MWLLAIALVCAIPDADALERSRALFAAADFEGALSTLNQALGETTSGPRRALIELERARCLSALRRVAETEAAIERALEADPTVNLEGDDSTRALRASFVQMKTRLAAEVTVLTEPPGLAVRLDGAVVGSAPVTHVLPVGRHQLTALDGAGREGASLTVLVAPRQKQTVVVRIGAASQAPRADGPRPWPVVPFLSARAHLDPIAPGVSFEPSLGLLGRFFVAELSVVIGGAVGLSARAGARLPFASDRFSAHLTVDGVAFFRSQVAPGIGGSAGLAFRALGWLEVFGEGTVWYVAAAPGFRPLYGLGSLGVRVRWPADFEG